ncbi:MAG: XrtA system polysaccharide chain length determinant [Burkholderiales bacterium]
MQLSHEQIAKALVNESFHSRRLIVGIFIVMNAAMLTAGLLWPRSYTASTSILVDERNIIQPLMQGAAVATDALDRSRNAREVIFGRRIMDLVLEYGGWLKTKPTVQEREVLIEEIKKRTVISTVGKNILRIEYSDVEPERAFRVTEKVAELYMQESIAAKAAESAAAFDFIENQTQVYKDKLTRTEEELKELRSSTLDARASNEGDVTTRVNDLRKRLEASTQELREAEVVEASLERQTSGEAEFTTDSLREGQYRTRIGELESKLDTLRLSYHDTHPDIVQVKQQIQTLTDSINSERARREQTKGSGRRDESVVNNPVYQQLRREQSQNQSTIDALTARIAELQRQLQEEVSRGKRVNTGDARLAELTRDYQVNRDIYQDLSRRRENARVSMNLDRERQGLSFKIQEPATLPPAPGGPRFLLFVLAGLLLGIAFPIGLLIARLQFDPRIRVGSAIDVAHKLPIMTVVPHLWTTGELKSLRWELVLLTLLIVATIAASAAVAVLRFTKVM